MSEKRLPHRVAIYAAPDPHSVWWKRGSEWLGRCAARLCALPQPSIEGLSAERFAQLTADPRRYGWHATLKAPFRLAPGVGMAALREGLTAIARDHRSFVLEDLQAESLGGFLALRPTAPPAPLGLLANDCVQRLQPLAARLGEAELARRRRAPLAPEEDALMLAWGYPWVLDRFQCHFSLTSALDELAGEQLVQIQRAAAEHFANLPPLRIDRLSIFVEASPGADFALLDQWMLAP